MARKKKEPSMTRRTSVKAEIEGAGIVVDQPITQTIETTTCPMR